MQLFIDTLYTNVFIIINFYYLLYTRTRQKILIEKEKINKNTNFMTKNKD